MFRHNYSLCFTKTPGSHFGNGVVTCFPPYFCIYKACFSRVFPFFFRRQEQSESEEACANVQKTNHKHLKHKFPQNLFILSFLPTGAEIKVQPENKHGFGLRYYRKPVRMHEMDQGDASRGWTSKSCLVAHKHDHMKKPGVSEQGSSAVTLTP